MNNEIKSIIDEIYKDVFCGFREQYIIVFLCGGASKQNQISLRDRVRVLLENEKRFSWNKPFKVFYPEELLIELLNKTKDADMLSYERFLADNSHSIVIICESPGALVELGAFANNDYTVDKVVAAVEKRHSKSKSFVMLGPIKYLRKRNKLSVIEYGSNDQEFAKKLARNVREMNKNSVNYGKIDLTNIVGMHYFIQLLLYFFKNMSSKEIVDVINYISMKESIVYSDFTILFNSALKLLFQDKKIVKIPGKQYSSYKLTNTGFQAIKQMISDSARRELCDIIRVKLMHYEFYKSPRS